MVCLPRTAEVLVALSLEMAEGFMDCTACTLARHAYLIIRQQTSEADGTSRSSDSIPDEVTMAPVLKEHQN